MPWLLTLSLLLLMFGAFSALCLVPPDYQQGDAFRILYLHVPLAALSLGVYGFMALASIGVYIWQLKLHDQLAHAAASVGMVFTSLTLITGAIWGKPMWGTWWLWDVRLTSELVLWVFYVSILLFRAHCEPGKKTAKIAASIALLGVVNLPIIHFSVDWWHSLHQKSTLLGWHAPTMPMEMLWPLIPMMLGFVCLTGCLLFRHAKGQFHILQRGRR